jgi:TonB-dependent starch-binding outer membrane protein SusC
MGKLKTLFCFLLLLTAPFLCFSQQKNITGKVTDKDGVGIQGVTVAAKGSAAGTQTAADGTFSVSVPASTTTLVFSSVGFERSEADITNQTTVNVTLTTSSVSLSDVVVVGYGTARRRDVTGAVTQVKSAEFNQGNITSPLQQLQGKAAGVVITQAGGDPNATPTVRVRGLTSLLGTGDPLYVIDGIVGADINAVAPNDIENVDILKDASSAAIYGARGANGVIIITTKKGRSGKTQVEYNGYVATDWLSKELPVLNGPEFKSAYLANGNNPANLIDKGANTNWQDEITRNAFSHNHNLAFGGGTANTNYRASVTYFDQQGIVINTDRQFLNGRLQLNQKAFNNKVNMALTLAYTDQNRDFTNYTVGQQAPQENPFIYALGYSPLLPIKNPDGSYFQIPGFSYQNPVAFLDQITDETDESLINASYKVDWEIFKGFTLSSFGSLVRGNIFAGHYDPINSFNGGASFNSNGMLTTQGIGNARRTNTIADDKLINVLGNYKKTFSNDQNLDVTLGYEYYDNFRDSVGSATSNYITDEFLFYNLGAANVTSTSFISTNSFRTSYQLASFLGRVNYSFGGKYIFTLNGRYDGSSKLGENNKWGFFPSAAASWVISQEDFMSNSGVFNSLKLRVGYGETGNVEPIAPYNSLFLYSPVGSFYANGQFNRGYSPTQINNEDLQWERRQMFNIGVDFIVFKNRLSGTVEYYDSKTKDMLFSYGIPSPPLPFDRVLANAGEMTNKGVDVTLTGNIIQNPDWRWNSTAIFGTVKNEITDLTGSFTYAGETYELKTPRVAWGEVNGQGLNQTVSYLQPGQSYASFFVRRFVGVDAAGKQQLDPVDAGSEDRTWIDPWNNFTYGWSNFVNFKNLDFNMVLRGQSGGKVFNGTYLNFANVNRLTNNSNVHEDALTNGIKDQAQTSDYAVQSSSFLRLESASLGYTFDTKNSPIINRARIYVAGNNLFLITDYKGYDPEVRVSGEQAFIDNLDYYPRSRSVSFGVNLIFN